MPEFFSNVEKEGLAEMRKALYLYTDGTLCKYEAVSAFSQPVQISRGPFTNSFSMNGDFLFLGKMVWILYSLTMLDELGIDLEGKNVW